MSVTGWTGVVLVGGKSSRMGSDKALIQIDGRTMMDRALDLLEPHVQDLLVIGDPMKYGHAGPFVIADDMPGNGPLGGVVTAMRYASQDRLLVLACDMPNINGRLLQFLQSEMGTRTDAVVPRHQGGLEPLAAAYHRRCESIFRERILSGSLKFSDALMDLRMATPLIEPGEQGWPEGLFRNLNHPSDL